MPGYYDDKLEKWIDLGNPKREMSFYTADDIIEVESVIGAWLKDNTLMVMLKSGKNIPIYEYSGRKAAQKALNIFWEHYDKQEVICCL